MQTEFDILSKVADLVGGRVDVKRVSNLVDILHRGGHWVHGVQHPSDLDMINSQGIKPLAAEGGWVSYWTTGPRVFTATSNTQSELFGIDSSFFHYAKAAFVITNENLLSHYGVSGSVNGDLAQVYSAVPRDAVVILDVRGIRSQEAKFEFLERTIKRGYRGGDYFQF